MKNDLKIPTPVMALQVILSALAGAATKLYLQNLGWLIQLIAFIIIVIFVAVFQFQHSSMKFIQFDRIYCITYQRKMQ